jgi:hypothetical protein
MSHFEQWTNIKFFLKPRKSAAETLLGLNAVYGDKALKNSVVFLHIPFAKNYA